MRQERSARMLDAKLADTGLSAERCSRRVVTFRTDEVALAALMRLVSPVAEAQGDDRSA